MEKGRKKLSVLTLILVVVLLICLCALVFVCCRPIDSVLLSSTTFRMSVQLPGSSAWTGGTAPFLLKEYVYDHSPVYSYSYQQAPCE